MSYILEALKKSEQERGANGTPGVQTIHSAGLQYTPAAKPLWPYLLAAVITLNVIALIVFFAPASRAPQPAAEAAAPPPARHTETITAPAAAPQQAATPVATATADTAPIASAASGQKDSAAPATRPPQTNPAGEVVDVHDLPPHIQARIPAMLFSAHVYSSNPQQRSVVINGNFMEQGDMLTPRLRLDEITSDGVVFDYDGTRFRTSVLSDWKVKSAR